MLLTGQKFSEIGIVVLRDLAKVERRVQFSYLAPLFVIALGRMHDYDLLTCKIFKKNILTPGQ